MSITPLPLTIDAALDPAWLGEVLGRAVARVEPVETIKTMASKARVVAHWVDGGSQGLCIKGFFGLDPAIMVGGGATTLREADFYTRLAPGLGMRVPLPVAVAVDRDEPCAVLIQRDLIADGVTFCSAREPFTPAEVAEVLGQLALLHAGSGLLKSNDWVPARLQVQPERPVVPLDVLQRLLDDPRGEPLQPATRSAAKLMAAITELARRDRARPAFLLHGDTHAGNVYRTSEGLGLIDWQLIQRGGWALDVAYLIGTALPAEVAAREERGLLEGYLAAAHRLGCELPEAEAAWDEYCEALAYGFYQWAVTRMVEPEIIALFIERLGKAMERNETYARLGVQ